MGFRMAWDPPSLLCGAGSLHCPWMHRVISTRARYLLGEPQTPLGIYSLPKTKLTTSYCPGDLGGPWPLTAFPRTWSIQWARKLGLGPGVLGPDAQGNIYRRHKNGEPETDSHSVPSTQTLPASKHGCSLLHIPWRKYSTLFL